MSTWPVQSLGDLFEVARGGSPRPIDSYITDDPDGINWIMIGDAPEGAKYIERTKRRIRSDGARRSRFVKPGDFLLSNSMSFGRPYILKTSGCIHDGWLVLSPKRHDVDPDFFFHYLSSPTVYTEFRRRASGVTVKNLNIEAVTGVAVPLPRLAEQRRIADILDRADAMRAKRREAIALSGGLLNAVFRDTFGDVAANDREWSAGVVLGDVAEVVSGVTKGRKLIGAGAREVSYLAVSNVQDMRLNLNVVKTIEATPVEIERYRLRLGDIVLTEGGDPDKLGRGTLWRGELAECIHQNHVFRVRVTDGRIEPVFLNWLLSSERGKRYFFRAAKQTTGIASINMTQLKGFPLLLPPVTLQRKFADEIAAVDVLVRAEATSGAELDALFVSLQHRAFRGEL